MSQQTLRKSATQCEVILDNPYSRITIDYNSECCRVVDMANYIKAECFSPKGNSKFRVRIEIESVADDEVSRPQVTINPYLIKEMEKDKSVGEKAIDYLSCDHIWRDTDDGPPVCRKCGNVKLTRRYNAEGSQSKR